MDLKCAVDECGVTMFDLESLLDQHDYYAFPRGVAIRCDNAGNTQWWHLHVDGKRKMKFSSIGGAIAKALELVKERSNLVR